MSFQQLIAVCLQQLKEKLWENAEAEQYVKQERVKTCMYNSFDDNSPQGEIFTPVKTGKVSSPRGNFFSIV